MRDDRPLRVLLVADYEDDPRLGSAKVAHKLRDELRAAGHHCDALFADALGHAPAGRQLRQLVSPCLAARAAARASSRSRYDVIDAASAEGLWIGLLRRGSTFRGTALVCRSNGLEHLNYRRMIDDSEAGLSRKPWSRRVWYPASRLSQVAGAARVADRLLLVNGADRGFALARGWQREDRIDVVPHGVSDRFLRPVPSDPPRGRGVLFCGTWDHVKGTPYLARAMDALAAGPRPVRLSVLGPGVPPAVVIDSFSERARPFVTVIDRVPEEAVIAEYRRHDLLVCASTYEGFGLVVLEAMSQGLPVISTPVGCAPDLIRSGGNGVLVPARDHESLARAIADLMDRPDERRRLGAAAARDVSGMTWRATAERTVAVYRRAIAQVNR